MLRIIGCPRSGTVYIANLLYRLGLKLGHERMGPDGVVGFNYSVPRTSVHGKSKDTAVLAAFDTTLHQVRHPLAVIGSLETLMGHWETFAEHVDIRRETLAVRAAMWLRWCQMCDGLAEWTYRIEAITPGSPELSELCDRAGTPKRNFPTEQLKRNAREHEQVTWGGLDDACPELARQIREQCVQYGYEIS